MVIQQNYHKIWVVYLIQADCGFTYVGQTSDLKTRLKTHRAGKSKEASQAKNPSSYKVLRLWPVPGYFMALDIELKVRRFLKNFGLNATLNWKTTPKEMLDGRPFHFAAAYTKKYTKEDCLRREFAPHPLGDKFDPELHMLCF